MLVAADFKAACRLAANSWSFCDLLNDKLHRKLMIEVTSRRPDLGITPKAADCIVRMRSSSNTLSCVGDLLAEDYNFADINTALQIVYLDHLPRTDRRNRLGGIHPAKMLAAIVTSPNYGKGRRRIVA
jgi:hypothetical protein